MKKPYILVIIILIMLFIIISLSGFIVKKSSKNFVIIPGVGIKPSFLLGKSQMSEILVSENSREDYTKKGLYFTFNNGRELTGISITSSAYLTDKNIKVGSLVESVINVYGNAQKSNLKLKKSTKNMGTIGETLIYPGIEFIIKDKKVACINVLPFEKNLNNSND